MLRQKFTVFVRLLPTPQITLNAEFWFNNPFPQTFSITLLKSKQTNRPTTSTGFSGPPAAAQNLPPPGVFIPTSVGDNVTSTSEEKQIEGNSLLKRIFNPFKERFSSQPIYN